MTEAHVRAFLMDLTKLSQRHSLILRGHLEIDDQSPTEVGKYEVDRWHKTEPPHAQSS